MAAAVVGALAFGAAATPAGADESVVSATIFPGSQAPPQTQTVSLSALSSCLPYQGPTTITLQPTDGVVTFPAGTTWTMANVITCGLKVPQPDVTSVQVVNVNGIVQRPMSPAQVFNADSLGQQPAVGVSGQTIVYARPWLGGADDNAADQVSTNAINGAAVPISIYLYENESPLLVSLSQSPGTGNANNEPVTVTATVEDSAGSAVSSANLIYQWSVNGAVASTEPAPTLTVEPGTSVITLQVRDKASGAAGTTSIPVTYNPSPSKPTNAKKPHTGAGNKHTNNSTGSPKGGKKSTGNNAPKKSHQQKPTTHHKAHKSSHTHTGSGHHTQTTPESSTTPPATTPPATPPPTPPSTTPTTTPGLTPVNGRTKPPPPHHHAARHHQHRNTTGSHHTADGGGTSSSSTRRVTGRLVADVEPLPPNSSPLVRTARASDTNAPLVHAASTSTSLPAWLYATAAVVLLLAGGAAYERRGRRARSLHR